MGPKRSVNLAVPVKDSSNNRQILEACANIQIDQVLMDPLICLIFELVLEVRIETRDTIFKEYVTLATFHYMPRISRSVLYPVELGDDYVLKSVSV